MNLQWTGENLQCFPNIIRTLLTKITSYLEHSEDITSDNDNTPETDDFQVTYVERRTIKSKFPDNPDATKRTIVKALRYAGYSDLDTSIKATGQIGGKPNRTNQ